MGQLYPAQEKKFVKRTFKVCNYWTMLATNSQEAVEDSRNKEKNQTTLLGLVCHTQLAFFLGSQNKQAILDSY